MARSRPPLNMAGRQHAEDRADWRQPLRRPPACPPHERGLFAEGHWAQEANLHGLFRDSTMRSCPIRSWFVPGLTGVRWTWVATDVRPWADHREVPERRPCGTRSSQQRRPPPFCASSCPACSPSRTARSRTRASLGAALVAPADGATPASIPRSCSALAARAGPRRAQDGRRLRPRLPKTPALALAAVPPAGRRHPEAQQAKDHDRARRAARPRGVSSGTNDAGFVA